MTQVIQMPDSINMLRNLRTFIVESSEDIIFSLHQGGKNLVREVYCPDSDNLIEIDIRNVVAQHLSTSLPTDLAFEQPWAKATFTADINGVQALSFSVLNGGVRDQGVSAENWLKANWLTWQPQTKQVLFNSPEYLSYYFIIQGDVKAKFYKKDGTHNIVKLASSIAGKFMTFKMTMSLLFALSGETQENLIGLVDVWVESTDGTQLSYVQRYMYAQSEGDESHYLCVNSLGGIDTFTFHGARVFKSGAEHRKGEKSGILFNLDSPAALSWSQNTGYMCRANVRWFWEFITSKKRWVMDEGAIEEIVLDTSSLSMNERDNLTACSFDYELSRDGDMISIRRSSETMSVIEMQTPSGEEFFLKGRMSDFPDAELAENILFLVQAPNSEVWQKTNLAALSEWFKALCNFPRYATPEEINELLNNLK